VVLAPGGPWVPGNANFWKAAGVNFGSHQQFWTKSHGIICGHETIKAASRPLNILHMGLMSDAEEWCWLWWSFGARPCQFLEGSWNCWLKFWQSPAILDQKPWHHLWSKNHISCFHTLEYPPYA
jgi:hypothetical protein